VRKEVLQSKSRTILMEDTKYRHMDIMFMSNEAEYHMNGHHFSSPNSDTENPLQNMEKWLVHAVLSLKFKLKRLSWFSFATDGLLA
jgi:hypothetical protein